MEAIKAANSTFRTPVAMLELDGPLPYCGAGGLCCSFCCRNKFAAIASLLEVMFSQHEAKSFGGHSAVVRWFCWCVGAIQCGMATVYGPSWPWHGTLGYDSW